MKNDIPFRVLGQALWFVIANLFTLFRLTWLPIAALLAAQVALGQTLADLAGGATEATLKASPYAKPVFWTSAILQTIALSAVAVRVHRLVLLDDRKPNQYFSFAFGWTEICYSAMVGLLIASSYALLSAFAGVNHLLASAGYDLGLSTVRFGDKLADEIWSALSITPFAVGLATLCWFWLRLALWPVVVVAENGLAPAAAWRITRGYAVSMFFLFVVASFVLSWTAMLLDITIHGKPFAGFTGQLMDRHGGFGGLINPSIETFAQPLTAERIAVDFALTFIVTSLVATLLSFAYLAIRNTPPADTAPATA